MIDALNRVAATQEATVKYYQEKAEHDHDVRFKISRTLPKITSETGSDLIDEITEFEREFDKTNPKTGKQWALMLDESLAGRSKNWRDFAVPTVWLANGSK